MVEPPRHALWPDGIDHRYVPDLGCDGKPRTVIIGPSAAVGLSLEARVHRGHVSVVEHLADLGHPAALVEHEAVVVLGVDREGRAVFGVGNVLGFVEVLSRGARADRARHRVELVPDRRRDPRPRDQDH